MILTKIALYVHLDTFGFFSLFSVKKRIAIALLQIGLILSLEIIPWFLQFIAIFQTRDSELVDFNLLHETNTNTATNSINKVIRYVFT